jgi:hypothetical protein
MYWIDIFSCSPYFFPPCLAYSIHYNIKIIFCIAFFEIKSRKIKNRSTECDKALQKARKKGGTGRFLEGGSVRGKENFGNEKFSFVA